MAGQTCKKCGRTLEIGQTVCACGARVEVGFDLPSLPGIDLPDLKNVNLPQAPALKFPMGQGDLGGMQDLGVNLGDLQMDFSGGRAALGRPYKPVLAVGKSGASAGQVAMPFDVSHLPGKGLYLAEFLDKEGRSRVQHFNSAGERVAVVREFELSGKEGLDTPAAIQADAQGSVYIVDMGASCIKKFSAGGELQAVLGGEGTGNTQLTGPRDLALSPDGGLVIADAGNNRVVVWDAQGSCRMVLGINRLDEDNGWLMSGYEPGEFDDPQGVAVDADGNIYVADTNNHRVQKFSARGEYLLEFGEEGESAGQFSYPNRVRVDAAGGVYVAETGLRRFQKFDPEGHFIHQVLLPANTGSVDGFDLDERGHLLIALRDARLVLVLEVV